MPSTGGDLEEFALGWVGLPELIVTPADKSVPYAVVDTR